MMLWVFGEKVIFNHLKSLDSISVSQIQCHALLIRFQEAFSTVNHTATSYQPNWTLWFHQEEHHNWLSSAGSCRTLSKAAVLWGRAEKRNKTTGRPGKGLKRSVAFTGILQGWAPPIFIFSSSPSPQCLSNGRDAILSACHVYSVFLLLSYNFWSLSFLSPLCLSTLSTGFFSPPPADMRVDYKVIQLEKTTRKWNKQLIKLFSAQKFQILAWISTAGIPPRGLCAVISYCWVFISPPRVFLWSSVGCSRR